VKFVSPASAARFQSVVEARAYTDAGVYISAPSGMDEYGQPTTAGTETAINCSFSDRPNTEKWTGYADVEQIAAEVRFSAVFPDSGGRFRITERFGAAVTAQTFEIIGIQQRGAFGYVCALKAVTI
jgi:hypothetical protein